MIRNEALFWQLHADPRGAARWRRRWLADTLETIGRSRHLDRPASVTACVDALWHVRKRHWGDRTAHAPAPRWFGLVVTRRPWLFAGLARGDFAALGRRLVVLSAKAP